MTNFEGEKPFSPRVHQDGEVSREGILPASREDVEVYIRTYSTMLRSSGVVKLKAIEAAHLNSDSALHVNARSKAPDMSAFFYCIQRLPSQILRVKHVLLGQSTEVFVKHGYDVESWETASAPGRRRRWLFDGKRTLAVYVSSASDVDDIIPTLTGFQIEWNKLNELLNDDPNTHELMHSLTSAATPPALRDEVSRVLQERLLIGPDDWRRLEVLWGARTWDNLRLIAESDKSFTVRMLGGTYIGYAKASQQWWDPVDRLLNEHDLTDRPVYFVSSNTHSLGNLLSGAVLSQRDNIEDFISNLNDDAEVKREYEKLKRGEVKASLENMLYYASRRYFAETEAGRKASAHRREEDQERGIYHIRSTQGMPIDVQVLELARLRSPDFDPRVVRNVEGIDRMAESKAVIINTDYPLGLAAYYIFVQVAESLSNIKGVYVLGKAATLNGRIGDVMIADSVYDEHSKNTYWLDNCFSAREVEPWLVYGSVLDNQKAVTVKGTYLQNRPYLDFYYKENYTVVEMEAGPYLNALYEFTHPMRYPVDENINFTKLPFDLGFLHYASDTPYTRGKNLGAIRLAYLGMDSAYATTVPILRRIFEQELRAMTAHETTHATTGNNPDARVSRDTALATK